MSGIFVIQEHWVSDTHEHPATLIACGLHLFQVAVVWFSTLFFSRKARYGDWRSL